MKLAEIAHSARTVGKSSVSEREEWNSIEIGPVVGRDSDDPWVIIISYVPKTPEHWPCVSDPIFLVPVVE
jgi:hypothetical protein